MKFTSLIFLLTIAGTLFAQTPIDFVNPSFEDEPHIGKVPNGWYNCGQSGESPPDIQPNGMFEVIKEPFNGNSYLGLVVRDNETWEAIGQKLKTPLVADTTYAFGIHLARSPYYISLSRSNGEEVNYNTPCKIRIWGGTETYCEKAELLYETVGIDHSSWKEYNVVFTPHDNYNFILIEAYYDTPVLFAYNGNILLDNISIDKSSHLKNETETELTTIQKDILAIEQMIAFAKLAKEQKVFRYFDYYSLTESKLLAKNFKRFEMNKSATALEQLIAKKQAILDQGVNVPDQAFRKFQKNCEKMNMEDILINDDFDKKIDDFIEKNKAEIEHFYDN